MRPPSRRSGVDDVDQLADVDRRALRGEVEHDVAHAGDVLARAPSARRPRSSVDGLMGSSSLPRSGTSAERAEAGGRAAGSPARSRRPSRPAASSHSGGVARSGEMKRASTWKPQTCSALEVAGSAGRPGARATARRRPAEARPTSPPARVAVLGYETHHADCIGVAAASLEWRCAPASSLPRWRARVADGGLRRGAQPPRDEPLVELALTAPADAATTRDETVEISGTVKPARRDRAGAGRRRRGRGRALHRRGRARAGREPDRRRRQRAAGAAPTSPPLRIVREERVRAARRHRPATPTARKRGARRPRAGGRAPRTPAASSTRCCPATRRSARWSRGAGDDVLPSTEVTLRVARDC